MTVKTLSKYKKTNGVCLTMLPCIIATNNRNLIIYTVSSNNKHLINTGTVGRS